MEIHPEHAASAAGGGLLVAVLTFGGKLLGFLRQSKREAKEAGRFEQRVVSLEHGHEQLRGDLAQLREHIDRRFDRLEDRLQSRPGV